MKKLFTFLIPMGICFTMSAQINSVPGSFNWTNPAAWVGGVVPSSVQDVNIVSNSTINLSAPLIHNADINILGGGSLTSPTPSNSLTINNNNLDNQGVINFVITNAVPITINNGHYFGNSSSLMQSGNFSVSFSSVGTPSNTSGDFIVYGNLSVSGSEIFDNNLYVGVSGTTNIASGCIFNNNLGNLNSTTISNVGTINNTGTVYVSGTINNVAGATINSTGNYISVGADYNNSGTTIMADSLNVSGTFTNSGSYTNNGGIVVIGTNFTNSGTITGSNNGQYNIAGTSTNVVGGIINGDIDICDATLVASTYLDSDMGTVDFNTVTFCSISFLSVESIKENLNISIYPNPSNGIFQLSNFENASIHVMSADGKIVLSQNIVNANTQIDLTHFAAGIYFMQIQKSNKVYAVKLIKK